MLNLVRQYGDDGEAAPEERRRGRGQGGRRPLGRGLREHHRRNQAQRAQRQAPETREQNLSLLVWWFGPLAEWPSNCEKSNHGNGWAVGPQIDFAMAAIPLAPLAAGLARCKGAAQAWRDTCPNYVKERHTSRPEYEAEAAQNNRFQPVSVRFSEDLGSARSCWTWQRELCAWRGPSLATTTGWTESSL